MFTQMCLHAAQAAVRSLGRTTLLRHAGIKKEAAGLRSR